MKPDTASISFSATGEGDSTKAALAASTDTMQKLMAVVDDLNIPEKDVVSEGVYTYQDYDAPRGWHASNTVRISVASDKAGEIMSKLADAGADGLSGPSFALEDQRDAYRQALRSAIGDARSKADAAAEVMGVKVSGVASMTESGASNPTPMMMEARGAADSAGPPRCRRRRAASTSPPWSRSRSRTRADETDARHPAASRAGCLAPNPPWCQASPQRSKECLASMKPAPSRSAFVVASGVRRGSSAGRALG